MATPRFDAAAEPKRVVPLERIRARTASAVRRVRYRVRPEKSDRASFVWFPLIALFLLAGVAGGYFLTMSGNSQSADDAPIVRSELEAETDNLDAEAKKSAFAERDRPTSDIPGSADFTSTDSAPVDETSDRQSQPETPGNELITVEEQPEISTEIELRGEDEPTPKQSAQRRENERLELIRKDAERQAAREREERKNRERRENEKEAEKPKNEDAPSPPQKPDGESDSEQTMKPDRF